MRFWQDKNVVVTGHTGFKGAWLTLWLQASGAKVMGIAQAPYAEGIFTAAKVNDGIADIRCDIRDLAVLKRHIADFQPEVVFHLAAQSLVRPSYLDPVETYATNVMGTLNVLEACRFAKSTAAIVVVTSDKCYENREDGKPFTESDPMGGFDPYSSSKGCAEILTASYRSSFLGADSDRIIGLATARAGNVIGGGDTAQDRLLPDLIRDSQLQREVAIRNPGAVRPWQHVLEPLHGYLLLAEKLLMDPTRYADAWNFGPEESDMLPVRDIVDRFSRLPGFELQWTQDASANPHEAGLLCLDCSKAKSQLGWRPRWNIDTALSTIAEWHTAAANGEDMREISLRQIECYETSV